jgi:hypothetical protein
MRLKERISELRRFRAVVRPVRLPEKLRIDEVYERISRRSEEVRPVETIDREALLKKLGDMADARQLSRLSLREMRLAASCLFGGERPLAERQSVLDQYLDALRSIKSRSATKRLIQTYFLHFDPNHKGVRSIGAFLCGEVNQLAGRSPWPERHRQFKLFDPVLATDALTSLTLMSLNPRGELEKVGLCGQLLAGKLAVRVFLRAMQTIQDRLEADPQLEDVDRAVSWVRGEDGYGYFSAFRSALANALLLPWVGREPNHEIRLKIQSWLLDAFDDPRLDRGAWIGTAFGREITSKRPNLI